MISLLGLRKLQNLWIIMGDYLLFALKLIGGESSMEENKDELKRLKI